MRKAKVRKSQVHARWNIEVKQPAHDGWPGLEAIAWADTHAEAMFLAQLLTDPHEYIRAAQERAWYEGKSIGRLQEYFKIPSPANTYREENQ